MTEPATRAVRPLSVHVPLGERRKPVAMVRLAVGPLEMVPAMSRLRKSDLVVRPPMAEGGVPAISAAPEGWALIEEAAFACALLNSQPMGFYAPAQIVRDARVMNRTA